MPSDALSRGVVEGISWGNYFYGGVVLQLVVVNYILAIQYWLEYIYMEQWVPCCLLCSHFQDLVPRESISQLVKRYGHLSKVIRIGDVLRLIVRKRRHCRQLQLRRWSLRDEDDGLLARQRRRWCLDSCASFWFVDFSPTLVLILTRSIADFVIWLLHGEQDPVLNWRSAQWERRRLMK